MNLREATGLLRVVTDYAYALDTLDRCDYQQLEIDKITGVEQFRATYEKAMSAIDELRKKSLVAVRYLAMKRISPSKDLPYLFYIHDTLIFI